MPQTGNCVADLIVFIFKEIYKGLRLGERIPVLFRRLTGRKLNPWTEDDRTRINGFLAPLAIVHGPYDDDPKLEISPRTPYDAAWFALVNRKREQLEGKSPNDPHALVVADVRWTDIPLHFELKAIDYAELCVLRETRQEGSPQPQVLSANALVVCAKRRVLMLHRRSSRSATYANCLHTVGGGYWPPGFDGREGDGTSLRHTAMREVFEETRARIGILDATPKIVLQEIDTGFIQLAYLGCTIGEDEHKRIEDSHEGKVVWVGFDDLEQRLLQEEDWVPTAKASILAWLAMGAPGAGVDARFAKKKAIKVFGDVLASAPKT
jgi:8-oxo-dGTP pyrophosphatase MutT (NUDIX family)